MNRNKFSGFLVILIGVTVLWFISKYKNVYEEEVAVEVQWDQIPEDIEIEKDVAAIIFNPRLRQRGFKLMTNKLFTPTLTLDFNKFTFSRNDSIFFNPYLEFEDLSRVNRELAIQEVDDKDFYIPAVRFDRKKVPIVANFKIKYANNFKARKPYELSRDSVNLYGKKELLDQIDSIVVASEPIMVNDTLVRRKLNFQIPLEGIKAQSDYIHVKFTAIEVTEGNFTLPVEVLNRPADSYVKVIPETVTVIYQAAISNFESITEKDIKVQINLDSDEESSQVMVPEIVYNSELIYHARLKEEAVQVLIVK